MQKNVSYIEYARKYIEKYNKLAELLSMKSAVYLLLIIGDDGPVVYRKAKFITKGEKAIKKLLEYGLVEVIYPNKYPVLDLTEKGEKFYKELKTLYEIIEKE